MIRNPLRICMLTTFYPPYSFGGDGIIIQRLAHALAARGHTVEIVHSQDAYDTLGGPEQNSASSAQVRVHRLTSSFPMLASLFIQQTGKPVVYGSSIRRIVEKGNFDVLHFHNISLLGGPGVLAYGRATKLYTTHEHWLVCPTHVLWKFDREPCNRKVCFACTIHSGRPPQLWRYTGLLARMVQNLDAILCPSLFTLSRHQQDGIQGNFVHLPHFSPILPEADEDATVPPYFLVVGRLEKIKGIQTLFPIFAEYKRAELWIAGTGTYERELRRLASGNSRIRFLGERAELKLQSLYRNALALIVPSLCYEVFGMVILEAFAQRTPAIARRLGALTEILEASRGGFLYSSDGELLECLARIQDHPATRENLGEAGREALLDNWTEEKHINRYLELIASLQIKKSGIL